MGYLLTVRRFSSMINTIKKNSTSRDASVSGNPVKKRWNPIPIPHRTLPEHKGQDFDFVNVVYSRLIHSEWENLRPLSTHLTPFRVKHILLMIQKDYFLSLEFFSWVKNHKPTSHTLETHSIILHILTQNRKFKSAESILKGILGSGSIDLQCKLFEAMLYSYGMCDSSPRVFDSLFKTYAHKKKIRDATDTFCQMKNYGFWPTIESCNKYLGSLLDLNRVDIALGKNTERAFELYKSMIRSGCHLSEYTFEMLISTFCKNDDFVGAIEVLQVMLERRITPDSVILSEHPTVLCQCGKDDLAMKLLNKMEMERLLSEGFDKTRQSAVDQPTRTSRM